MCEWSGHNVRVNMECASDWLICASRNVRVVRSQCASEHGMCESKCASGPVIMCE